MRTPYYNFFKNNRAFTLIELLVVIAIVALLSSIIFGFMGEARAEARDKKKIQEANQVRSAIALYRSKNSSDPMGTGLNTIDPTNDALKAFNENSPEYASAMEQLVSGGFMPEIPSSPNGEDYYYLIDESGNGIFSAVLESDASMNSSNGCYFTDPDIGSGDNASYTTTFDRDSLISEGDSCSGGTCGSVSDSSATVTLEWFGGQGRAGYSHYETSVCAGERLPTLAELIDHMEAQIAGEHNDITYEGWAYWTTDVSSQGSHWGAYISEGSILQIAREDASTLNRGICVREI